MLKYNHNEGAASSEKLYIKHSFSATAVTLLPPLPRQWTFLAECWNKTDILPPSPFCVWLSWLSRSLQNCPEYRYRLFRADLQYENYLSSPFYRTAKMLKYNHNEEADAPIYIVYLSFQTAVCKIQTANRNLQSAAADMNVKGWWRDDPSWKVFICSLFT